MAIGTVIVVLFLLLIAIVIGYFIGKYITEGKKWGQKRAELEKEYVTKVTELEKEILIAQRQKQEIIGELEKDREKAVGELKKQNAEKLALLEQRYMELIKGFRKDAVSRSRNTLLGKLWEQITPYLPKFKYNPSDMRFLGSPIDYIIFEGMNKKDIQRVVFLEVKTKDSQLNAQEKKLKEAIQNRRVKWEEFRFEDITQEELPDIKEFDMGISDQLKGIRKEVDGENIENEVQNEDETLAEEFECENCGENFTLDKNEMKKLKIMKKITVTCPHCGSKEGVEL